MPPSRLVTFTFVSLVSATLVACWGFVGGDLARDVPADADAPAADAVPPGAALTLSAAARQVNIVRGASASVELALLRGGGFSDAVSVSVTDLPDGVTADPLEFPAGATSATLTLYASAAATLTADGRLTLQATSSTLVSPSLALPIIVQDPSGTLDHTFGTGGITSFKLSGITSGGLAANGIVVRADGRIAVCGTAAPPSLSYSLLVAGFTVDGHLDTQFASGGLLVTQPDGYRTLVCSSMRNLPSGGIVLSGFAVNLISAQHMQLAVKLTDRGVLDTAFGGGTGLVAIENGDIDAKASSVVVQPDGKLILSGFQPWGQPSLVRLTAEGLADPTFDPAPPTGATIGVNVYADAGPAFGVLALEPGGIWAAGSDVDLRAYRATLSGKLDSTFGKGGVAATPASSALTAGTIAIVEQPGGGMILVGSTKSTIETARFTAEGTLDPTYGSGGRASTSIPGGGTIKATAAAAMADGRIVIAATLSAADSIPIGVVRLTATGALDETFAGTGFTGYKSSAAGGDGAVAVDAVGRIILAAGDGASVSIARFWP